MPGMNRYITPFAKLELMPKSAGRRHARHLNPLVKQAGPAFDNFWNNNIKPIGNAIGNTVSGVGNAASGALGAAAQGIATPFRAAGGMISGGANALKRQFQQPGDIDWGAVGQGAADGAWNGGRDGLQAVGRNVGQAVGGGLQAAGGVVGAVGHTAGLIPGAVGALGDGAANMGKGLIDATSGKAAPAAAPAAAPMTSGGSAGGFDEPTGTGGGATSEPSSPQLITLGGGSPPLSPSPISPSSSPLGGDSGAKPSWAYGTPDTYGKPQWQGKLNQPPAAGPSDTPAPPAMAALGAGSPPAAAPAWAGTTAARPGAAPAPSGAPDPAMWAKYHGKGKANAYNPNSKMDVAKWTNMQNAQRSGGSVLAAANAPWQTKRASLTPFACFDMQKEAGGLEVLKRVGSAVAKRGQPAVSAATRRAGPEIKMTMLPNPVTKALPGTATAKASPEAREILNKIEREGLSPGVKLGLGAGAGGVALYGSNRMGRNSGLTEGLDKGYNTGVDYGIQAALQNAPQDPGILGRILNVFRGQGEQPSAAALQAMLEQNKASILARLRQTI
jgi:hypothetical protein